MKETGAVICAGPFYKYMTESPCFSEGADGWRDDVQSAAAGACLVFDRDAVRFEGGAPIPFLYQRSKGMENTQPKLFQPSKPPQICQMDFLAD